CTRSPTSPVGDCRPMWPACSRRDWWRRCRVPPGRCRRWSRSSAFWAACRRPTGNAPGTPASAWSSSSTRRWPRGSEKPVPAPAVLSVLAELGGVSQADRERTWNLRVGMVLVVDPAMADGVIEASPGAWVLGEVVSDDGALADDPFYVQGAKGVDGGAAILQ